MIKTINDQILDDWNENSHHMIDIEFDAFKKAFDNVFQKISNSFSINYISFQIEPACSVLFEIETIDKEIIYLTNRFDEDCLYFSIYNKRKFPFFKKEKVISSGHGSFDDTILKIKNILSNL